jgi:hypothetical protein
MILNRYFLLMIDDFDATRLRRGMYLLVVGASITTTGLAIGWDFATGARFTLLGPVLFLAGIGYIGAAAVPLFVTRIGGEKATWEDLSFLWQMLISAIIAIGLFVVYLIFWSLLP